jgi:hypothetical protein
MFIRDGLGAIRLCDVACGRLLGFIEAHFPSLGLPRDRPVCQYMRNPSMQHGSETVPTRENDPVAACPPMAGGAAVADARRQSPDRYAALRRGFNNGDAVPASAGLR